MLKKNKVRVSLAKKIFFNFLILSIVPIIIIDSYFYYKSKEALINRTFDQLTTVRIEKTIRLKDFFNQSFNNIKTLSNFRLIDSLTCDFNSLKNNSQLEIFKKEIERNIDTNIYNKVILVNKDNNICYFDINDNYSIKTFENNSDDYKILLNAVKTTNKTNETIIYDVKNDYSSKNNSILLIRNIENKQKQNFKIIFEISLNAINKIMYENNPHNGLGKTGETYLVGADYFMRSSSRFKDNSIFNIKAKTDAVLSAFNDSVGTKEILDYRNILVLSSFSKVNIKGLNWVILSEIDTKEAMVPIHLIINDILFMSLILSILLLGLVELLSSKITAPIKKLKLASDKISEGQLGKYIDDNSNDEIGDLIIAFNKMTTQLEEQSVKLEKERKLRTKSLFDGQEIERQRLSRELHDSLGQSILALKMKFERISESSDEKRLVIITETKELFSKIMTEIRNISNDLMPAVLREFGLLIAIKKIIREFTSNTNIKVSFENNIEDKNFNKKTEVHIYRIIQEAFSNILKHSKATNIFLSLKIVENNIELTVKDNGIGFEMNQETHIKGNGISNINERINILEGTVKITTEINKGTEIYCKIPIN